MKLVARLLVIGMLLPIVTFQEVAATHFNQSADYRSEASEQMSPGGKFAASVVVGAAVGVVGAEALKQSAQVGGLLGVLLAGYAFYLLKTSREDAVAQAVGPEYVGVSAITALASGMVVYRVGAQK